MYLPIAIHKDVGTVFGVTVPDVPGCHSYGETVEEAIFNAKEAIRSHIETLIDLGEDISVTPSDMATLMGQDEYSGAMWAMVDIDEKLLDTKPERVNISIPRSLLQRIDNFAALHHQTRSGFISQAAKEKLSHV